MTIKNDNTPSTKPLTRNIGLLFMRIMSGILFKFFWIPNEANKTNDIIDSEV